MINILRFVAFVLIQGLILNHVNINGYLNPLLYVMFILLLPFDMSRPLTLILAFLLGYAVDLFSGTPGMHAAASVFVAFVRPYFMDAILKHDEEETGNEPTIRVIGFRKVVYYNGVLVLIHHMIFFFIEAFRISEFLQTMVRALLSSVITIALIIVIQFLFFSKSKTRSGLWR
ncbi:MAG: rod shape-determining protein MreD [Bacteroidales bacterium]|nr:rod shape-determining protein MreD [Bacteroidales bacterium]